MVTREYILSEIRRTTAANSGQPLGRDRFEAETGIRETDWSGRYWARWSDAVREAGYTPNVMQTALPTELLLEKLVSVTQELHRFPTNSELGMKSRSDPTFPNPKTFQRLGSKAKRASLVLQYCDSRADLDEVAELCRPIAAAVVPEPAGSDDSSVEIAGFVYLLRLGKYYKIGRSVCAEKRAYEVQLVLPEELKLVHKIMTDDPVGIEAYWHSRFAYRRLRGEWFNLTAEDVRVFRRRKFM